MDKAYLILETGDVFEGERIGARKDSIGELVFTTGMCGYLETLTDPSYFGQIIMQTFPLIGNYGVIEADFEGECRAFGYIVRELCDAPSNFRSQGKLNDWLIKWGVPGLAGVDTRAVTTLIRTRGVMNAMISDSVPDNLDDLRAYSITNAVSSVSARGERDFPAAGGAKYKVALIDYGEKRNIARSLNARGCNVISLPFDTSAEDILALKPDGVMLSNGPGDPAENTECVRQISKLMGRLPMFGICLGHQLMALAAGARTEKLPFGHRGANQPVRDKLSVTTYITSQNHGYAVAADSLKRGAVLRYVNANDLSCEGVDYTEQNAFSVQFHPESCAGPMDTMFLFDRFVKMMEEYGHAAH